MLVNYFSKPPHVTPAEITSKLSKEPLGPNEIVDDDDAGYEEPPPASSSSSNWHDSGIFKAQKKDTLVERIKESPLNHGYFHNLYKKLNLPVDPIPA